MSARLSMNGPDLESVGSGENWFAHKASVNWQDKCTSLASILKPLVTETSGTYPPLAGPFGTVTINENNCSGCGACIDACRVGALQADDKNMTVLVREIKCTDCGLCQKICPENAILVVSGLRWNSEVFETIAQARVEGVSCLKCDKVFATRRAIDSVAARLQERFGDQNLDHLLLCPDCRVIVALTEEEENG